MGGIQSKDIGEPSLPRHSTPLKILKISEMAASINGKYLGEVGNSRYPDKTVFTYDPAVGLEIKGQKGMDIIMSEDFVELPGGAGFVTVERLLGKEPRTLADQEFEVLTYAITEELVWKTRVIKSFVRACRDEPLFDFDIIRNLNYFFRPGDHPTPEQLLQKTVADIDDTLKMEKKKPIGPLFQAILDPDTEKSHKALVALAEQFIIEAGFDPKDKDMVDMALAKFWGSDVLIEEAKKEPSLFTNKTLLSVLETAIAKQK